jgi:hypothetical protein
VHDEHPRAGVPWTARESARFHRALAVTIAVLAAFILTVAAVRQPRGVQQMLLALTVVVVGRCAIRIIGRLRRTEG